MKTIYLLETHPVKKEYYTDVHCGHVNTTKKINEAFVFDSYENALEQIKYLLTSDFESEYTLYMSIVKHYVKN